MGYVPNIAWISGKLACDEQGYLTTDSSQKTNTEGMYGAGDACIENLRRVVTAVSDGAVAATFLGKHASSIHEKLGIPVLEQGEANTERLEGEMTDGGRTLGKGSWGDGARGEDTRGENIRVENDNGFLSVQIRQQPSGLPPKLQEKAVITVELDDSSLAGEMSGFLGELEGLTDRIICKREYTSREEKERRKAGGELFPAFRLGHQDGREGNILFHGVSGGYEFNSFIMALCNMAGSGQPLDEGLRQRLSSISKSISMKMVVPLSYATCPEVVMTAQRTTSLSGHMTAEMIDLMHYPDLGKKYNIMSIPCMVISGLQAYSGKKSLEEATGLLEGN